MFSVSTTLVRSWLLHITRSVQARVEGVLPSPRSIFTRSTILLTASEISARTVSRPVVARRSPLLTDEQAQAAANAMVSWWEQQGEDHDMLKDVICRNVLALTERSARLSAIDTVAEVAEASRLIETSAGLEVTHLDNLHRAMLIEDLLQFLAVVQDEVIESLGILVDVATENDLEFEGSLSKVRDLLLQVDHFIQKEREEHDAA